MCTTQPSTETVGEGSRRMDQKKNRMWLRGRSARVQEGARNSTQDVRPETDGREDNGWDGKTVLFLLLRETWWRLEEEDKRQRRMEMTIIWGGEEVAGSTSPLTKRKIGRERELCRQYRWFPLLRVILTQPFSGEARILRVLLFTLFWSTDHGTQSTHPT